jgi:hypothetical protein
MSTVAGRGSVGCSPASWGVTTPFWFAFAGSALFLVLIWRELRNIAHADAATVTEQ